MFFSSRHILIKHLISINYFVWLFHIQWWLSVWHLLATQNVQMFRVRCTWPNDVCIFIWAACEHGFIAWPERFIIIEISSNEIKCVNSITLINERMWMRICFFLTRWNEYKRGFWKVFEFCMKWNYLSSTSQINAQYNFWPGAKFRSLIIFAFSVPLESVVEVIQTQNSH